MAGILDDNGVEIQQGVNGNDSLIPHHCIGIHFTRTPVICFGSPNIARLSQAQAQTELYLFSPTTNPATSQPATQPVEFISLS